MWPTLALPITSIAAILFIPGILLLRAIGFKGYWTVMLAPIFGLSLIAIIGQILALTNVPSTPVTTLGSAILLPTILLVMQLKRGWTLSLPTIPFWLPLLCLILGFALGDNLFLSRIGSPDALLQEYDVTQHLNLIRSMADSGTFTSFQVSPYLTAADQAIAPTSTGGFYPAAWHAVCALAVQITGCSVPLVINASMVILAFVAFPFCMVALITILFGDSKKMQICGALTSLAFVAFPWNLLTFGPIYANVAGFALMPAAMTLFVLLLSDNIAIPARLRTLAALLLSIFGLALCHPNTIFTCIVFLAPYCISRICTTCNKTGMTAAKKYGLCSLFIVVCVGFWLICYHLPIFKDTVSHVWPPYTRTFQSVVNILTLCYNFGFHFETGAQLLLGILVVFGCIRALHMHNKRWMVASYALICFILLVSATRSDELKQLLAGFWYTDPMRLASIAAIAAMPLAALGCVWTYDTTVAIVEAYCNRFHRELNHGLIATFLASLFLLANFIPEFNFPGLHKQYSAQEAKKYCSLEQRDWPKSVHTTFGDYRAEVENRYSYTEPIDLGEKYFIDRLDTEDYSLTNNLVINNPMDGSFLAYGTDGIRLYYRNFVGYGGSNETTESRIIREHLNEYASNPDVQEAVEAIDARYVLQLRDGGYEAGFINLRGDYNETQFIGITSITEDTPGFTCVYDIGILKLYEIDR